MTQKNWEDDSITTGDEITASEWISMANTIQNAMGVVVHGSTASTARPSGYVNVTWIGSVEPSNAMDDDVWINTST